MKFISIQHLLQKAKEAFLRFPATILSSFLAVCVCLYLLEYDKEMNNFFPFVNTILCAGLGIPLYFFANIFSERNNFNLTKKAILLVIVTLVLVGIYFTFPSEEFEFLNAKCYIRFVIYNLIAHLLVSFAPYLQKGEMNGFWQYNYNLFIRFCTAVVYSGFLFLGLVFALLAVDALFDISIDGKNYARIFIIVGGLFNTWFFVSGIPKNFTELEQTTTYPKELKFFAQYILLPLLGVYLVILYAYGSKIILSWDWPRGIVSYLIICVSVLGIFTFLLMHPYGKMKENNWIYKFSKAYYFLLIPLIIILFIAIGIRISDYGITVNRYIILALGVWLLIVALSQIFRSRDIKFIPISLSIFLLFMSFGPWSMFSVGERSQANRLKKLLSEKGILVNNKVSNEVIWDVEQLPKLVADNKESNKNLLSDEENREVHSILEYLQFYHGFDALNPLFEQDMESLFSNEVKKKRNYRNLGKIYAQTLGLKKFTFSKLTEYYELKTKENTLKKVSNFDYYLRFQCYSTGSNFNLEGKDYTISLEDNELVVASSDEKINFETLKLANSIFTDYGRKDTRNLPQEAMIFEGELNKYIIRIELNSMNLTDTDGGLKVNNLRGGLLLKRK